MPAQKLRRVQLALVAIVLGTACHTAQPPIRLVQTPFPVGAFVDDYGGRHTVSAAEWRQGATARYHIVSWNPAERYLIARNDDANPTDGGKWTRIDWLFVEGMAPYFWAFCFSAWNAESAAAAEAVQVARPETPRTGCNGFPFSRLKLADAPT